VPLTFTKKIIIGKNISHQRIAAKVLTLAAILFLWASPVQAAIRSAQFDVSINLLSDAISTKGLCLTHTGSGTFGATITYVCSTGTTVDISTNQADTPVRGDAYRFLTHIIKAGVSLGTVDSYSGGGTITSWRMVNLANREYLEMMVHW